MFAAIGKTDARDGGGSLDNPNRLLLVSSSIPGLVVTTFASISSLLMPPLCSVLGGVLFSLHARVARWILHNATPGTLTVAKARACVDHLRGERDYAQSEGSPSSDGRGSSSVHSSKLYRMPRLPAPAMLRLLRNSGQAL